MAFHILTLPPPHFSHIGIEETTNAYKVLVGNLEGNVTLGRPRQRWKNKVSVALF
jgi:hypothetical protein